MDVGEIFERQSYRHIFACLNTYLNSYAGDGQEISILDAGCGDGKLIMFLRGVLPELYPNFKFTFLGFDVNDHGVQEKGFLSNSIKNLVEKFPEDDWMQQISIIGSGDDWVNAGSSIDFVLSNQVLEHVKDLQHFFSEVERVLKNGGVSINLFPIGHNLVEPHLRIPFAHWIKSWDLMNLYIKIYVRARLKTHNPASVSADERAESLADYLLFNTRYRTEKQLYEISKACDLRASFRFSSEFYSGKIRSLFGMKSVTLYQSRKRATFDAISIKFLRYVSNVTLCLEKKNTYQR